MREKNIEILRRKAFQAVGIPSTKPQGRSSRKSKEASQDEGMLVEGGVERGGYARGRNNKLT